MKGWVYFARFGDDGPIKIGRSSDPYVRVSGLSCTPTEVTLLGAMLCARADLEEKALHEKLLAKRIKGEWFEADAALAEMNFLGARLLASDQIAALEPEDSWARTERFELRMTAEERDTWKDAALRANLSLSEWIRTMVNAGVDEEIES